MTVSLAIRKRGQVGQYPGQTKGLASYLSYPKRPLPPGKARRRGDKVTCFSPNHTAPSRPYTIFRFTAVCYHTWLNNQNHHYAEQILHDQHSTPSYRYTPCWVVSACPNIGHRVHRELGSSFSFFSVAFRISS